MGTARQLIAEDGARGLLRGLVPRMVNVALWGELCVLGIYLPVLHEPCTLAAAALLQNPRQCCTVCSHLERCRPDAAKLPYIVYG